MIRVIKHGETSVNFVDDQENFVGYSLVDACCAHGDWFIDDKIHNGEPKDIWGLQQKLEFPDYVFDETFFKDMSNSNDKFSCVVFRFRERGWQPDKKLPALYLHLYNCHNGYYAKGFKTTFGEKREGSV